MRRAGFLALMALAVAAWTCHVAEAKCRAPAGKPKVRLDMLMGDLAVIHDLGRDRIKALSDKVIGHVQGPWHVPLGLTHGATAARYETAFTYSRDRGMYCVSLTKAEISVGLVELTVYVSNEYARGTCQYEAIHAHEMDHVKRNREVVKRYQERIRKALSRVIRAKRVIRVYTKAPLQKMEEVRKGAPFVLPQDSTVADASAFVHKELVRSLKYAVLWGDSGKFDGQHVGRDHQLHDGDLIELHS